jgi:HIRAN domain-containing protein
MSARAIAWAAIVLAAFPAIPAPRAAEAVFVVQRAKLAGLRHYEAPGVWREIRVGDRLRLVREPANPHDASAVRVEWRGRMLGYLARRDNAAAARQLDRGVPLEGRVVELRENRNRSLRFEFEVVAPLAPP